MVEEWRAVVGWEGYYEVSDQGRVRSVDRVVDSYSSAGRLYKKPLRGKLLATTPTGHCDHRGVSLCRDGVPMAVAVHVLVAEAFLGPRPPGLDVTHRNRIGHDNRATNLRYATVSQNNYDPSILDRRRVTRAQVALIRAAKLPIGQLAAQCGVSEGYARRIQKGERRMHG